MTTVERPKIFDSYNAGYVQSLYEEFLQNPNSVDENWRRIFETGALTEAGLIPVPGAGALVLDGQAAPTPAQFRTAIAAAALVDAYRLHGHHAAELDPLGSEPEGHPALEPEYHATPRPDLEAHTPSIRGFDDQGDRKSVE